MPMKRCKLPAYHVQVKDTVSGIRRACEAARGAFTAGEPLQSSKSAPSGKRTRRRQEVFCLRPFPLSKSVCAKLPRVLNGLLKTLDKCHQLLKCGKKFWT